MYSPVLGYTPDDQLWLGAGFTATIQGFRKTPYKSKHKTMFSISPTSRTAFHLSYNGDFNSVLFNYVDLNLGLELNNPLYINYFGLGNETIQGNEDSKFNWVRMRSYNTHFYLKKTWVDNRFHLYMGPTFSSWSVKNVEDRVLDNTSLSVPSYELAAKNYLGGVIGFNIDSRDNEIYPTSGIVTNIEGSLLGGLKNSERINNVKVEQKFYFTFGSKFATTIVSRTGWERAGGDLNFYNYATLGNTENLRGFRNQRFSGNHIFYQNLDLRLKLINWNNKILPMKIGLIGGYDVGRVWLNNENSSKFHHSYTAGVWFNVFSSIVVQPHMSFSKEEKQFNFKLGFNF